MAAHPVDLEMEVTPADSDNGDLSTGQLASIACLLEVSAAKPGTFDAPLSFQNGWANGGHSGFLHGQVDSDTLAGLFALVKRQQQCEGDVVSHRVVHVVVAGPYRRPSLIAGEV